MAHGHFKAASRETELQLCRSAFVASLVDISVNALKPDSEPIDKEAYLKQLQACSKEFNSLSELELSAIAVVLAKYFESEYQRKTHQKWMRSFLGSVENKLPAKQFQLRQLANIADGLAQFGYSLSPIHI